VTEHEDIKKILTFPAINNQYYSIYKTFRLRLNVLKSTWVLTILTFN